VYLTPSFGRDEARGRLVIWGASEREGLEDERASNLVREQPRRQELTEGCLGVCFQRLYINDCSRKGARAGTLRKEGGVQELYVVATRDLCHWLPGTDAGPTSSLKYAIECDRRPMEVSGGFMRREIPRGGDRHGKGKRGRDVRKTRCGFELIGPMITESLGGVTRNRRV
ncbi:hypothetical protein JAAARDRAFT_684793, partial [Jaapia argillacea MUCL 33604]